MLEEITKSLEVIEERTAKVDDIAARLEALETRAARPGSSFGERNGVTREERDHVDAFNAWLRAPGDTRAADRLRQAEYAATGPAERRTTSGLTGTDGGHSIPAPVMVDIVRRVTQISPIRGIARAVTVSSTATKFPLDRAGTASGWVAESGTRTATAEPVLDLRSPTYGTEFCYISATEEIVMDSALDIGAWLADSAVTALAAAEGLAFCSGNGTNRPTGFLAGPTPVATADATRASGTLQYVPSTAAATITADSLVNLFYTLKAQHRASASWVMSSATAAVVQLLKDSQGRSFWSPSLADGTPATLLGRPVVYAEDMPAVAANAFPIAFGNFRAGYLIADQGGLRITFDDNISTPGLLKWYVRRRVGGCILDSEAIKVLRVSTS
ncbi:MAG: phage major capsid protein [Rhodobacter sp.]|nr:phage major capsid protein [Rhodobacter sp.]MCA3492819.1 phage major capsid protein [Rhodobacter sp.]MCA3500473.1 phage major capsid protein [Rhodobacter sp.]MCA3502033.1 phage major capsid protein [Rhodobacter sp.]MCA3518147.1 phage major capsid protein [Rhodobacter sp.]